VGSRTGRGRESTRVLVTGGSGFIGRNLCTFLTGEGHEVVATYLASEELSARQVPRQTVAWQRLDMQDAAAVQRIVEETRADAVFHLAAQAYAQKAWSDPLDTFRTNVLGTISLYEALRNHPPREGVLLAASGSAYGVPRELPIREDVPLNPTNPYGVSKACQDMLSLQYSLNFGLRILRARLFGTTGPGKTGDALNDFARQVHTIERTGAAGTIKVGNLDTRRDVSDIRDVIRAMWRIFEAGSPTEAVNVGAGESYPIRDIAESLVKLARVPVRLEPDPALFRPTDEPDNRADVSRLTALGYTRKWTLSQTIADALEFWRQTPES
jgi:GDP-4-dehydro-6-deoxy-D-mannose reductase